MFESTAHAHTPVSRRSDAEKHNLRNAHAAAAGNGSERLRDKLLPEPKYEKKKKKIAEKKTKTKHGSMEWSIRERRKTYFVIHAYSALQLFRDHFNFRVRLNLRKQSFFSLSLSFLRWAEDARRRGGERDGERRKSIRLLCTYLAVCRVDAKTDSQFEMKIVHSLRPIFPYHIVGSAFRTQSGDGAHATARYRTGKSFCVDVFFFAFLSLVLFSVAFPLPIAIGILPMASSNRSIPIFIQFSCRAGHFYFLYIPKINFLCVQCSWCARCRSMPNVLRKGQNRIKWNGKNLKKNEREIGIK